MFIWFYLKVSNQECYVSLLQKHQIDDTNTNDYGEIMKMIFI